MQLFNYLFIVLANDDDVDVLMSAMLLFEIFVSSVDERNVGEHREEQLFYSYCGNQIGRRWTSSEVCCNHLSVECEMLFLKSNFNLDVRERKRERTISLLWWCGELSCLCFVNTSPVRKASLSFALVERGKTRSARAQSIFSGMTDANRTIVCSATLIWCQ